MLILAEQRLVFLEVPKTASTSVRRMLIRALDPPPRGAIHGDLPRHQGIEGFLRDQAGVLQTELGGPVETFCVIRAPLDRLHSWYRYRQRAKIDGTTNSTRDMSFDAFVTAYLAPEVPSFARSGRQDRFVGFADGTALVDHLFDYARLDLLEGFLSDRLRLPLRLPKRNASVPAGEVAVAAPLMARYRKSHAAEFELYDRVHAQGMLHRI